MRTLCCWLFLPVFLCAQENPPQIGFASFRDAKVGALGIDSKAKRMVLGAASGSLVIFDPQSKFFNITGFAGHKKPITTVLFAPDDKTFATASQDGTVKIWDTEVCFDFQTKSEEAVKEDKPKPKQPAAKATITVNTSGVNGLAYYSDGKTLVAAGADGVVKLLSLETLKASGSFQAHAPSVRCLTLSPDGKLLATGGDKIVKIWQLDTKPTLLHTFDKLPGTIGGVVFSPDGKWLVSGGAGKDKEEGDLRVWDVKEAKEAFALTGHTGAVTCVAFHPLGDRLVSGSADKSVRTWDFKQKKQAFKHLQGDVVRAVSYSGDGLIIASCCYLETKWFRGTVQLP